MALAPKPVQPDILLIQLMAPVTHVRVDATCAPHNLIAQLVLLAIR